MKTQINITREAQSQYEACIEYVRVVFCEERAAKNIENAFVTFMDNVTMFPEMYPIAQDRRLQKRNIRRALIEKYVALYLYEDNVVTVIGFFHQLQDYACFI